ncbi:MAG: tetratricopeptide repeat-containing sensor histidine kinase [Sphingobacteriales bacterium]|nr:MAG: tetratricopeptide repeat-containing sensor histidine kinase [Sphingobacteriales bacterium]
MNKRFAFLFLLGFWYGFARAESPQLLQKVDSIATTDFETTLRLCDSLLLTKPGPKETGILHRLRGKAFYFKGQYEEAAQEYATSVDALRAAGLETERGLTFLEQARLFRKMKMYEEAIGVYRRAETIFRTLADSCNLSTTWNEWGVVYEMQEDFEEATRFYTKSLQIKEALSDSVGIAYAHSFIATTELGLKHFSSATLHGMYAFRLFERLGDPFPIAIQSADLGVLFQRQRNYPKAIAFLQFSDSMAQSWDYKDLRLENYRRLSRLYYEMGHFDSAYAYQDAYVLLKDSIFTQASQKTIAELNARYELAEKDAALQRKQAESDRATFGTVLVALLLVSLGVVSFVMVRHQRLRNKALIKEHYYREELAQKEAEQRLTEQRNHISRELHDNIGSYLTFISSSIDRIQSPDLRVNPKITGIKELTQETIVELRKTVWLLNNPALTAFEWQLKLQDYYRRFPEVCVTAMPEADQVRMSSHQATYLFRVVQEAINNALKYSGASRIQVAVRYEAAQLQISVQDCGKGFDPEHILQGYGMTTMRQRTEELGGWFQIQSTPNSGTEIRISLPFKADLAA